MSESKELELYLSQASVSPEVFRLRPDYRALLVAIEGITPGPSNDESEAYLQAAEQSAHEQLGARPVTDLAHIASWREAYKAFGAKPNKYRNSLEALT